MSTRRKRFTHRPGIVLRASALVCAAVVMVLAGTSSMPAFAATVVGFFSLAAGLVRSSRRGAAFGAFALLAGVLAAGAAGTPVGRLLVSTAAALLAWDFGAGAFAVNDELAGGTVERIELLRVATAIGVGAIATGAAYVTYRTLAVGPSLSSVVLLVVAATALGLALRD